MHETILLLKTRCRFANRLFVPPPLRPPVRCRGVPGGLLGIYLAVTALAAQAQDDWPQFRGPNSSGISLTDQSLPVQFSDTQRVTWQQPVGDGVGGAVVAAGRVFVSGMTGTQQGEPLRRPQRVGRGGSYFASPVSGDGKIYLASSSGVVLVLQDNASYEELAANDLGESIVATPAVSGRNLLVRTRTRLFCIAGTE